VGNFKAEGSRDKRKKRGCSADFKKNSAPGSSVIGSLCDKVVLPDTLPISRSRSWKMIFCLKKKGMTNYPSLTDGWTENKLRRLKGRYKESVQNPVRRNGQGIDQP